MLIPSPPQTILIIKLSAIGDIVMCMPVATQLRQRYPEAKLIWLTQVENAGLLQAHADIDQVIVWDKRAWQTAGWRSRLEHIRTLRRQLHAEPIDLALDLQGLFKSGFLAWLSGAKQRIGLGSREGSQWLMHRRIARGGDNRLISSEYRFFVEQLNLGAEIKPFRLDLARHLGAAHRQEADELLLSHALSGPFVALCPFTTRAQKHWHAAYWSALIERIVEHRSLPVVILGGPNDRDKVEALRPTSVSPQHCLNLCGQTSLLGAAAVLEKATLVLGVDTGLTHMATALYRPTLAIFGSTLPYSLTDNPQSRVAHSNRDCSPCRRHPSCDGRFDCMSDLRPEQIEQQAFALLETKA